MQFNPRLFEAKAKRKETCCFFSVCEEFICTNSEGCVLLRNGPKGWRQPGRRSTVGVYAYAGAFLCLAAASVGAMADIFIKRIICSMCTCVLSQRGVSVG